MAQPAEPEPTRSSAEALESDGFVILENAFDPAFVDALHSEYQRQFPDVSSVDDAYEVGERRLQVAVQLTGPFLSPDFYANRKVLSIVETALGEDILIDNLSVVTALPGAEAQDRHKDHHDLFREQELSRWVIRPYALNVAIPLVDLTPETGTTKLYAASHNRPLSEDRFELAHMKRGGCYIFDYRLWHQGTENRTQRERPIVYIAYSRPWFTDIANYGDNVRINLATSDLPAIPPDHRPLFRRLAARGALDRTVKGLFAQA